MPNVHSWLNWIEEFKTLQDKMEAGGVSLGPADMQRLVFLRNLLEAGMGTKTILSEDNRRKDLRTPCELGVTVIINGSSVEGKAYNISHSGTFISADPMPSMGDRVAVEFHGLNGEKITREGVVKRVSDRETVSGSIRVPPGAGLEFDSIPFDKGASFRKLFYKVLEDRIVSRV